MAKENTHIFFAHTILEHFRGTELLKYISEYIDYYYLGCVIPDTFFYNTSMEVISETLHGKNGRPTNEIIFKVLERCADMRDTAFIMGYITHCALDITFHPIAYYLSGNYYDPDPIQKRRAVYLHRYIETCMDMYLENPLKIYSMVRPYLVRSLQFEQIICDEFSVSPADIRRALRKQLLSNRLFASNAAYWLARFIQRYGKTDMYEYLGLFYSHVAAQGNCIPEVISYRDIVSGAEKTTTINEVMTAAKDKAVAMMAAAYEYSQGRISKEKVKEAIPGESLDTGRLNTTVNSIRYTASGMKSP